MIGKWLFFSLLGGGGRGVCVFSDFSPSSCNLSPKNGRKRVEKGERVFTYLIPQYLMW
jgi:hypothetical protein